MRKTLLLLVFLLLPLHVVADDAVKALDRLEFRCRSEVDYFDYVNLVKDAEFEISRARNDRLKSSLEKVLSHYQYAVALWEWRTYMQGGSPGVFAGQNFFKDYPGAEKPIAQGGAIHNENQNFMSIDAAILYVWDRAASSLKEARTAQ